MNKVLRFTLQLTGFSVVGLLFFVWYLGYRKNNPATQNITDNNQVLKGTMAEDYGDVAEYGMVSSDDYSGPAYLKPPTVAKKESLKYTSNTAGEPIAEANVTAPLRDKMVRNWKGVHRDGAYNGRCFERFEKPVLDLSEEHGLYPDIFMSRVIAYSYEFTLNPKSDPFDKNFTAMKMPKGTGRAKFKSAFESLKAYAVVNAGEITRLSHEGALAKHERSWTMQKIIETYTFVKSLNEKLPNLAAYDGMVGPANKVSKEELYEKEVFGEAIKMASKVDDVVKDKKAKDAGYSNWEAYIDDLPQQEKAKASENTKKVISAVSKKKAFNLKRRVAAKKSKVESK